MIFSGSWLPLIQECLQGSFYFSLLIRPLRPKSALVHCQLHASGKELLLKKRKGKRKSFWDDTYCWKFPLCAKKQNLSVIYLFITALHPPKLQLFNLGPARAVELPVESFCVYYILKTYWWYERFLKSQLFPSGNELSSSSWHSLWFWEENPGPAGIVCHACSGNLTKVLW